MNFAVAFRSDDNKIVYIVKSTAAFQRDYMVNLKLFFATQMLLCSGQPIPDSGLSFSSATAGGNPSLN